jgi:enterochelin esterase family protein
MHPTTPRSPQTLAFALALAVAVGCSPSASESAAPSTSTGGQAGPAPARAGGNSGGSTTTAGGSSGGGASGAGGEGTETPPGADGTAGSPASTTGRGGTGDANPPGDAGGGGATTGGSDAAGNSSAGATDPGSDGDGDVTMTGPYDYPPEATLMPGVTAGKLIDVPVTGKIFASRTVQVYVPSGYVEKSPAPFLVLQDGPGYVTRFKLPTVLDNLIAKKQLPVMLAIFVPNGGAAKRSIEYDTLSDAYVRFVLEEILPAVEAGAPVKLTTDPEGRGAGGHSSGGIAAFTMGWQRPDQFRRILTHSGSFVSIRGGDKYPEIVKGMPRKPLRVYLSVGTKDNEAPRWQRGNEAMAAALKQQGYHYRFMLQMDGTHAQTFPASNLPEALLWLWRGYPIAGK